MASLASLKSDVASWLNRADIDVPFPGWVAAVDLEMAETLRARCQVTSAFQNIDRDYVPLPSGFATMESIRDAATGELLELKDEWSGHWSGGQDWVGGNGGPATAYRLVANCIEFMPHLVLPDPPDPSWIPQQVLMGWYAKPVPLLAPTDTNPILEQLYPAYLFGLCKYGAMWALDDARAQQMDAAWQQVVTRANMHKQQSDLSGAPLRAELAMAF